MMMSKLEIYNGGGTMQHWKTTFPLIENAYPVLCKITPPAQHAAARIIEYAKLHDIDRVIIFGSSTTWNFGPFSDIDICVDSNMDGITVQHDLSLLLRDVLEFDLVMYNECTGFLKTQVDEGVIIYERNA